MANTQISRRTMQIESDYEIMAVAKETRAKENRIEKRRYKITFQCSG